MLIKTIHVYTISTNFFKPNHLSRSITRMSSTSPTSTIHVLPSRKGNVGMILLNNPSSLNALTIPMIHSLNNMLPQWQKDDSIKATIFQGSPKGNKPVFCAGGDVKSIYMSGTQELNKEKLGQGLRGLDSSDFFRHEYQTNYYIASQSDDKPQISIWDGVVMGGGLGLSIHGKYRVATENILLAMPETAIGLFPDVGGMYWLPRLPNGIGIYMALTGYRCNLYDCLYLKLATHHVPSAEIPKLLNEITGLCENHTTTAKNIAELLNWYHEQSEPSRRTVEEKSFLFKNANEIQNVFSIDKSLEDIIDTLQSMNTEFSRNTLDTILKMSPTSCKVTLAGMKYSLQQDLCVGKVLQMEYRMSQRFMKIDSDFYKGIRAVLVDKDHKYDWYPKCIEDVSDDLVKEYFNVLGSGYDLELVDCHGNNVFDDNSSRTASKL